MTRRADVLPQDAIDKLAALRRQFGQQDDQDDDEKGRHHEAADTAATR